MARDPSQIVERLGEIFDVADGKYVTKEEMTKFLSGVVEAWKRLKSALESKAEELEKRVTETLRRTLEQIGREHRDFKGEVDNTLQSFSAVIERDAQAKQTQLDRFREDLIALEASVPEIVDLEPLRAELATLRQEMPEVKTLPEVWEAIEKLKKELKKDIERRGGQTVVRGIFGGGRPVHIPMVDDWSGDTDGATKTFYLSKAPRSLTTMKIWGSDFPYILRVNTDFTVSNKTVTLTSEVNAPTSGATLIAEYYT